MAAVVIADASPLIALARINGVPWLAALFGGVLVPEVVLAEVLTGRFPDSEAPIAAAIQTGWLQLATTVPPQPALPDLDEGEAASIRLALARGPQALLLIDERRRPGGGPGAGPEAGRHCRCDRPGPTARPDPLGQEPVCRAARQRRPHRTGGDSGRAAAVWRMRRLGYTPAWILDSRITDLVFMVRHEIGRAHV